MTNGYALGNSGGDANQYQTHNDVLYVDPLDRYTFGVTSGVNTSGNYADFTINLNNVNVPWDYTLSTPTDPNATSLASVLYHEAIHSMGFAAYNGADGSYDYTTDGGTSNTLAPTLWDTKLYDGITNQAFTADTDAQRAAVEISGDANGVGGKLFFDGKNAMAANGGKMVQMFAPNPFQPGSSDGLHLGPDNPNADLLDFSLGSGIYLTPSNLDLAMLSDIGWKLNSPAAVPEASTTVSFGLLLALGLGGVLVARKKSIKA